MSGNGEGWLLGINSLVLGEPIGPMLSLIRRVNIKAVPEVRGEKWGA